MSEFTAGILYLQNDAERVQEKLQTLDLLHKTASLSEKWAALFLRDEWMRHEKTWEQVLELSLVAPLLSFYNAEDHGWGYDILQEGASKAEVNVQYETVFNMTWQKALKQYPESNPMELDRGVWDALQEEVRHSQEYKVVGAKQFANKHVAAFELFGLSTEQIAELDRLLQSKDGSSFEVGLEVVGEFKSILGLDDFSWVSYEYVEDWTEMKKARGK